MNCYIDIINYRIQPVSQLSYLGILGGVHLVEITWKIKDEKACEMALSCLEEQIVAEGRDRRHLATSGDLGDLSW